MSSADIFNFESPMTVGKKKLEYLRFVEIAAIQIVLWLGKWYDFAKDIIGPLKLVVEAVEGIVKNVAQPMYEKVLQESLGLLLYIDGKVSKLVTDLDHRLPPEIMLAAHIAPFAAQSISSEFRRAGFVVAASGYAKYVYFICEPKAKEVYSKWEPRVQQNAVYAWYILQQLPLFPKVAQLIILPTASLFTRMYNETVKNAGKVFIPFSYLPLVPIEKIVNLFTNEPALAFG